MRVFIDLNYTFAPRLKVGRLPGREEAARSPVYPVHLFVFSQTQFQMLQKVVPNNWIGIPGNTSNPNTSKTHSEKLLAPYDALVYREESQLMTYNQGKKLETTRFVLSSITSSPEALFACAHLACNPCCRLSISSFKTIQNKKHSFPVQLRSSVEGPVSSKKLGIVDEVLISIFALRQPLGSLVKSQNKKKGYKLKRKWVMCEFSFRMSTVERYPASLQSPPSAPGTSEWLKQAPAQLSGYPFAASSR